jgi:cytosine/adenosine deaminase-related metal-dependent hydrolase
MMNWNRLSRLLALTALAMVPGCQSLPAPAVEGSTLIRNVALIPMDRPNLVERQDVLVRGDRIVAVGPTGSLRARFKEVIDGTGKFLIPGLWDMHVHALGEEDARATFARFADHGIVGVRDLGSTIEELKAARGALAAGPALPRLIAAGPLLDGPRQPWMQRMAIPLADAQEARAAAERLADEGVDFLKVYNNLSREQFDAVAAVARARGLPFAGHVPFRLTVEDVSAAGQASIEHAGTQLVTDCIPDGRRAIPAELNAWIARGYSGRSEERLQWWAKRNAAQCTELYDRMAVRRTWVTPTLTNEVQNVAWTEQEIDRLPAPQAEACRKNLASMRADLSVRDAADQLVLDLVRELHARGVPLLAGTDTPNGCLSPGESLHLELELLVRAGLSPWQALQAATSNPAVFLGLSQEGTIRPGNAANLVLLDRNPLLDIRNSRTIRGVMIRGSWHRAPLPARD